LADTNALFAAILADRRDDNARLAYADAIAGSDPDHAAFIRVQLDLAGGTANDPAAGRDLKARERKLAMSVRAKLQGAVRPPAKGANLGRGFVQRILIEAVEFVAHGADLFSKAPILDLRLLNVGDIIDQVCRSPQLKGLRSLDLGGNGLDDSGARAIANSPHLAKLRWLDLHNNRITDVGLDALAASANLGSLAHLVFGGNTAADPTPQIAEENGAIHYISYPQSGKDLQAKHGHRAWLGDEPRGLPRVEYF
jgi:uncharacterized protein (TIGR02996 family)